MRRRPEKEEALRAALQLVDDALGLRRSMLRDVERVIDHQVTAIEQLDGKASNALTLAVSGFPLLALLATRVPGAHPAAVVLLAGAGAVNGLVVLWLLRAHHAAGGAGDVSVGPSPAWVADAARDGRTSLEYCDALLVGYARYAEDNARFMAEMRRRRQAAVTLLLFAGTLYGLAALALVLPKLLALAGDMGT